MKGVGFNIAVSIAVIATWLLLAPVVLRAEGTSDTKGECTESVSKPDLIDPCMKNELIGPSAPLPGTEPVEPKPQKHIVICLADQKMRIFENDKIVERFLVSTGRPGHNTPPGSYHVVNRSPKAYSKKYECYMLQWMSITRSGEIGMHSLEGHAYERHLGHVASHGCIRLSHKNAEWLYDWVEIGIPVDIVAKYTEPVEPPTEEEVLAEYPFHF